MNAGKDICGTGSSYQWSGEICFSPTRSIFRMKPGFFAVLFSRLGLFLTDTHAEAVAFSAVALLKRAAVAGSYASARISGVCAAIGKSPRARGTGWLPHLLITSSSFHIQFVLGLWKICTFLLVG